LRVGGLEDFVDTLSFGL